MLNAIRVSRMARAILPLTLLAALAAEQLPSVVVSSSRFPPGTNLALRIEPFENEFDWYASFSVLPPINYRGGGYQDEGSGGWAGVTLAKYFYFDDGSVSLQRLSASHQVPPAVFTPWPEGTTFSVSGATNLHAPGPLPTITANLPDGSQRIVETGWSIISAWIPDDLPAEMQVFSIDVDKFNSNHVDAYAGDNPNGSVLPCRLLLRADFPGNPGITTDVIFDTSGGGPVLPDPIAVDFAPRRATTSAGHLPDQGQRFGVRASGYEYGWTPHKVRGGAVRQEPLHYTPAWRSFLPLRAGSTWEIAVPNGTYEVELVCGDVQPSRRRNDVLIEGVLLRDPEGRRRDTTDVHTATIVVGDGRLSIQPGPRALDATVCAVRLTAVALADG